MFLKKISAIPLPSIYRVVPARELNAYLAAWALEQNRIGCRVSSDQDGFQYGWVM